jgi:Abnormal spindle-like microcephaly-assoc'd, ASPM-SPD-2-Hydin
MNFGEVSKGNSTSRIVNVVNDSDLATSFQFLVDRRNVFSYSITEGVVSARGSVRVIITFTPPEVSSDSSLKLNNFASYYERVF